MKFRIIIVSLVALLQLLLPLASSYADTATMNARANNFGAEIVDVMNGGGDHTGSLPPRMHLAPLLQSLPTIPEFRSYGGFRTRMYVRADGTPSFLASSLRTSFLRHSVLLI